jgi:anaerobic magnesium-protoporphyrin IX monomethyl ester cyclase
MMMQLPSNYNQTTILVIFNEFNRGPVVLYELLVKHGHHCLLVYYLDDNSKNRKALIELIKNVDSILVGFGFASQSSKIAFDLADQIKKEISDIPIIFGGVHPTVDPLSCLDHCNAVCIGEGENSLLDVVEKIKNGEDYLSSKNLIYKKDGSIIQNPVNPLIIQLDSLPKRRPYTEDHFIIENGEVISVDKQKYFEILPNEKTCYTEIFSRGCPYSCTYCCNSKYSEIYPQWSKIRSMSVQRVIDEIEDVMKIHPQIIKIFIIDDCFLAHDIEWLKEFTKLWNQKIKKELNFFTIPQYVKKDKIEILKSIDLSYCSIGLQTGSEKINKLYNRHFSKETFLHACNIIKSLNIGLVVNVIFDNPWENEEDMKETIDILTQIKKPFYIMQYSLKIYPGTKLFNDCQDDCLPVPDYNSWFHNYNIIKTNDLNRLVILSQFLPRNVVLKLCKQHHSILIKYIIRFLYIFLCLYMPFHALRVSGSKYFTKNIRICFSHHRYAVKWIKGLLGLGK